MVVEQCQYTGVTPIIKVSGKFCNLRCKYCFYATLDQSTPTIMSYSMLERVIEQSMQYAGSPRQIRFVWHGGEPLLAGLKFYERVVELQHKYNSANRRVLNAIQTNGTLIDEKWAKFFAENNFGVGISLDGCQESHDRFRVDAAEHGSFNRVVRGIRYLQAQGLNVTVIMVLRRDNLFELTSAFETFVSLGLKGFGANTYFEPNLARNHDHNKDFFISPQDYTVFLKQCVDLWLQYNSQTFGIREIDDFIAGMMGLRPTSCTSNGTCSCFITIEEDGSVYPCERLPHEDNNYFGTITSQQLDEIIRESPNRKDFVDRTQILPIECVACPALSTCNNGCTHHQLNGKYYYCSTRREIYDYIQSKVGNQLIHLRTQQTPS